MRGLLAAYNYFRFQRLNLSCNDAITNRCALSSNFQLVHKYSTFRTENIPLKYMQKHVYFQKKATQATLNFQPINIITNMQSSAIELLILRNEVWMLVREDFFLLIELEPGRCLLVKQPKLSFLTAGWGSSSTLPCSDSWFGEQKLKTKSNVKTTTFKFNKFAFFFCQLVPTQEAGTFDSRLGPFFHIPKLCAGRWRVIGVNNISSR